MARGLAGVTQGAKVALFVAVLVVVAVLIPTRPLRVDEREVILARLEERGEDVNPNGGGISLGHPLGATGARITATLVNELERRDARYGLATMCIGFGQAIAAVIERV